MGAVLVRKVKLRRPRGPIPAGLALLLLLGSACSYGGGDIGNPFTRKFEWYGFIGGNDIRAQCAAGGSDRFRLVFNGRWDEQVRIYDLDAGPPSMLAERALGSGDFFAISLSDPVAPWRGRATSVTLTEPEYDLLLASFAESGVYGRRDSPSLGSDKFYWIVAACHDGRFTLNAWLYPSPEFDRATFPQRLLSFDKTGIAYNDPRKAGPTYPQPPYQAPGIRSPQPWSVWIRDNRLADQLIL